MGHLFKVANSSTVPVNFDDVAKLQKLDYAIFLVKFDACKAACVSVLECGSRHRAIKIAFECRHRDGVIARLAVRERRYHPAAAG